MKGRKAIPAAVRKSVYRASGGRCSYCGCELRYRHMQVDHVVSLHNHGADDESNMAAACRDCNHLKGACSVKGFRRKLKKFLSVPPSTDFQRRVHQKYENWDGLFLFEKEKPLMMKSDLSKANQAER
ncbi:MAG: HNH endonuclease [Clostridia bacterium]|nr:HNH endonuclease [Clostridia bacterium]